MIVCVVFVLQTSPQTQYPFQNPDLPIQQRIDNILSLMTIDEKIECLDTTPSVPRLGIKGSGHVEGIHGLTQGGPGKWGRPKTVPSTTFPQGIGLGETWDPEILRQAGEVEGYEARYVFQSPKYNQGGIVIRSPNADIGRDPRWGRNEECYGEDAYFNGTMVVAFSKGLQGNDPKYWLSAALMKHFLANSNENDRDNSSSNFDERLFHEYYSLPFRMGVIEGGSRAYMAAYNAVNGVPMTINPILQNITREEWGQDGIICTDAGAMRNLVSSHKQYPDFESRSGRVSQSRHRTISRRLSRARKRSIEERIADGSRHRPRPARQFQSHDTARLARSSVTRALLVHWKGVDRPVGYRKTQSGGVARHAEVDRALKKLRRSFTTR